MSRLPPISDQDWTAYTAQRFRTRALRQIAESMPALPKYTPPPAPAAAPSAVAGAPPSPVPPPVAAAPTLILSTPGGGPSHPGRTAARGLSAQSIDDAAGDGRLRPCGCARLREADRTHPDPRGRDWARAAGGLGARGRHGGGGPREGRPRA